jgi:uncharacterized protein YeeX (DUF496 family)
MKYKTNDTINNHLISDSSDFVSTIDQPDTQTLSQTLSNLNSPITTYIPIIASIQLELNQCKRCKTKFNSKRALSVHINLCKGISSLACPKCFNVYTSYSAKYKHTLKCNIEPKPDNTTQIITTELIINTGPITNQTNNITINIFGQENINHVLNRPDIAKYVKNMIKNKHIGFLKLFQDRHFHPDAPENHNLRKYNKKSYLLEAFDGTRWMTVPVQQVADIIMNKMRNDYEDLFQKMIDKNGKLNRRIYEEFMISIGEPLDVHAISDDDSLDWDYTMNEAIIKKIRIKLSDMVIETIYLESKKLLYAS